MTAHLATAIVFCGILGLFWLDRDREARSSPALWLPVIWLWIAGSRMLSQWLTGLGLGSFAATGDTPDQYLDGSPLDRYFLAVLLGVALVVLFSRRQQVLALLKSHRIVILFFLYAGLSVTWSDFSDVAFKRWIKALGDLVMVLIVLTDADPAAALKRLLKRVGFVLLPLSVLLIKYYPDLGRIYKPEPGIWLPMWTGVTTNKNFLGIITLLFGLGSLWRLLNARRQAEPARRWLAHLAILAIALWLFSRADSVTSLTCFMMGCIILVATHGRALVERMWVIHALVAGMVSTAIAALFFNTGGLINSLGRDPTLTGRTDIWKLVLGMAGNSLFGTGFESFWLGSRLDKIWAIYWWKPNEAHNGYIEIYLNLGWIGIALLALLIFMGYAHVIRNLRQNPKSGGLWLAYLVIAVIYNCTEAGFRMLDPIWIFFLLALMSQAPAAEEFNISPAPQTNQFEEYDPEFDYAAEPLLEAEA